MQVKGTAVGIVEGLTGSPDGIEQLKAVQQPLVTRLFRMAADKPELSRKALNSLVNLSQDPAVGEALLKLNAVSRIMEFIREGTCPHADLMVRRHFLGVLRRNTLLPSSPRSARTPARRMRAPDPALWARASAAACGCLYSLACWGGPACVGARQGGDRRVCRQGHLEYAFAMVSSMATVS